MSTTRSSDDQLEAYIDNPEEILKKKKSKMPTMNREEGAVPQAPDNPATGNVVPQDTDEEVLEDETTVPTPVKLYLPDMENTTLTTARKRSIPWGHEDHEFLVECPGIKQYYGVDTLLVNFETGSCQLYTATGELEVFPLACGETPFPLSLATTDTSRPSRPVPERASSPAFTINNEEDRNQLTVRTSNEGPSSSFIVPTMTTGLQNCPDNQGTVSFEPRAVATTSSVNQWLIEIANNNTPVTTVANRDDRPETVNQVQQNNSYQHTKGRNESNTQVSNNGYQQRNSNYSYTNRTCNICHERGHLQRDCTKSNLYCDFFHTRTHDTAVCRSKPKQTSTPLESPSAGNYHPTQSPAQHNNSLQVEDPNKSIVPNHVTQPSPAPSSYSDELLKAWITRMDQNQAENREAEYQNRFLDNIEVYDSEDKTKCLPWVNRVQQAATCSTMKFRKALLAKAGPTVFRIVASTPENIEDLELKQVILQNFSDIATRSEAAQKLRTMRMSTEQPFRSYNYYYAAVHEAAFEITPDKQFMRFALEDYTNSLPKYTAGKLSDKIVKRNSFIKTLQDAMDHAAKIDQESRQAEVMRSRRNANNSTIDTTINATVDEVADWDVNYITTKQGDSRLNSTMKPGHYREGREFSPRSKEFSPRSKQHDTHHNRPWNGNRRDCGDFNNSYRRVNKYKHPAREARNNIKFKYSVSKGEQEIMGTLRKMIEYLRGKSDREVESIKHMPKYNPREVNEVSKDSIATITIDEIQRTLKEDVNIVYDALVASDFIEEIAEA